MRPTGAVEYVLHDHLGSARITLDNAARVIESRSYTAFGDELTSSGTGARTSYIGRETDNESDLGFYGVRLYDPTYGRFLSTDPLWSKYLPLQSFQYAGNSPVMMLDDGGKEIVPVNLNSEEQAMLQTLISILRSSGDAFINQILDFAEGCETQIHVHSLPFDRNDVTTSTRSVFGYQGTIESYWKEKWTALGITVHLPRMAGAGEADVVLASDNVLRSEIPGYAAFVVLDELHHVYSRKTDSQNEQHVALFSYLIEKMQNGSLQIPGLTIADVQAKLNQVFSKLDRHKRDPTIQHDDANEERSK
jgi:RHS repeat-associated protein